MARFGTLLWVKTASGIYQYHRKPDLQLFLTQKCLLYVVESYFLLPWKFFSWKWSFLSQSHRNGNTENDSFSFSALKYFFDFDLLGLRSLAYLARHKSRFFFCLLHRIKFFSRILVANFTGFYGGSGNSGGGSGGSYGGNNSSANNNAPDWWGWKVETIDFPSLSICLNEHTNRHSPFDYFNLKTLTHTEVIKYSFKKSSPFPEKHRHSLISSLYFHFQIQFFPFYFWNEQVESGPFFFHELVIHLDSFSPLLSSLLFITNLLLIF